MVTIRQCENEVSHVLGFKDYFLFLFLFLFFLASLANNNFFCQAIKLDHRGILRWRGSHDPQVQQQIELLAQAGSGSGRDSCGCQGPASTSQQGEASNIS